ncbi:hypothetical protein JFL43_02485 [Viridibacillus sp. YIM B01967]|uniref:Uncharacterized protein n=1 Tax=Viridibacillus soli TaxID=2798301 RepID=A0ABS1H3V5_9BACL|nr:hypothetical protein [Viridibacillus soli]MBK3493743.1 hypothetical protein [Viridibacillus soli]
MEHARDVNGDFYANATLIFSDFKKPGGTYDVIWKAMTNNDTEGWYQLHGDSSSTLFSRIK